MKLLIVAQKVDENDPILGFFHRWIVELSKQFSAVTVICLELGENDLPHNVEVFSLGKEERKSRMQYLLRFYRYVLLGRKNYDAVFVHMNQEYVLLAGWLWRVMGKRVYLWRNHVEGDFGTRLATLISNNVFYTSPQSFVARYEKAMKMPVGIILPDSGLPANVPNSILFLGRISPIKNVRLFVESILILNRIRDDFSVLIEGDPINPGDVKYLEGIKELATGLISEGKLSFASGKTVLESMRTFARHSLYVNLTPGGSLDKAIFGAMASRTTVLVANPYFEGILPPEFVLKRLEPEDIARQIGEILGMSPEKISAIRDNNFNYVRKNHDVGSTIEHLTKVIKYE